MGSVKCGICAYLTLAKVNGGSSRYYCKHPVACKEHLCGGVLVSRCDRGSDKLKTKTSPKWCPLRKKEVQ